MDFLLFATLVVAAIFLIRQLQKDLKKVTEKAERRRREELDLGADQT